MHILDPRPWVATLCAVLVATAGGCSAFGLRTADEAPYDVLVADGPFELREYAKLLVAETTVDADFEQAGNIAFRRLFSYISGDNTTQSTIAMTAPVLADAAADQGQSIDMTVPVIAEPGSTGWRYAFVLPREFTVETAPAPIDDEVELAVVPSKRVASIRFAGSWEEAKLREKAMQLLGWLEARGYQSASQPRSAGYDPPWTIPFLRRNEVLIDVL